jgi:cytochrome d ubiquinol oxidase subunit II
LREDFRLRAIVAGTATAALAAVVLVLAYEEAHWFFDQLLSARTLPVVGAGLFFFVASAHAVFTRRYRLSRYCAVAEIVLLLTGWGIAQHPYLAYPDFTLVSAAGPAETIRFLLMALPVGAVLLVPSLWLMFKVFKGSGEVVVE